MGRDASNQSQPMMVLYIAGVGRSGSTLLERILGAIPGFVNAGELVALFPRVAMQDQRCGCGQPFSMCPYWRSIGAHGFSGWDPERVQRIAELQPRVVRQRFIPYLLAPRTASPQFRRDLGEYVEAYRDLYTSIAEVSGARVLVDASKSLAQLFALRHIAGLDLRVLNLVRDSRGVAHSWSKTNIKMPQVRDPEALMRTYAPHRLAVMWSALQMESALLRSLATHSARIRYEDLVANPRTALEGVLTALDLPPRSGWLDHVDGSSATLDSSHGLAGSRSRFKTGRIEMNLDDDWRSTLAPGPRRLVTTLTLPQLASYGYLGSARVSR